MASAIFDKLWEEAFEREGELVTEAAVLAQTYKIASALEAIALARVLQESGRPFFEYCRAVYMDEQKSQLERLKRQGRLKRHELAFLEKFLQKAMKGW